MSEVSEFELAQKRVQQLKKTPAALELLQLYALYKQGTRGDVEGARPSMLDVRGRAKFDAWSAQKGQTPAQAQEGYVALVAQLEQKYGAT